MFARSTTLHGKAENLDAGMRYIENEVRPVMDGLDGCLGMSCIIDRASGQAVITSSWTSEETMRASDERLKAFRERAREIFGGSMQVDEWEIAVMRRRDHGGACRVTWAQGDLDALIDVYRYNALPTIEEVPGFCGTSLMVNRTTGVACVTTTYRTREELEGSRAAADQIRARSAEQSGMEVLDVHEFDLVYAHLHVPELV